MAEIVTVTSKGQVVIPRRLRKELNIVKGEKLWVVREGNAIKMFPVPKLSEMAGGDKEIFKGRRPSKEIEKMRKEWTGGFEERVGEA